MLYAILAYDKPEGAAIRSTTRAAHLDYLKDAGERLKLAGAFRDGENKPVGSLIVIEAASETAARLFAENDPYAQAGLFERVEIRPFAAVLGAWMPNEGEA